MWETSNEKKKHEKNVHSGVEILFFVAHTVPGILN
jgi:hypothetical protein